MRKFFKTVMVVTIFSVCEKFLGFLYRIFLSRKIGSEGMGLYQVALSVFALLFTICCSGTPITVSRLMTKYNAEGQTKRVNKIITAGLAFTLAMAIPICLLFFLLRSKLGIIFSDTRCIIIFLIVLPTLILNSVYAVLRGVFWGSKDFLAYSIIELLEEICMIIVGIILISKTDDVYKGAIFAGVAVAVSYLFSFTLGTAFFFFKKNKLANPKSEFKPLLSSALPVTAMRTANSFAVSLVSIILPMRLISAGYTNSAAMSLYGAVAGEAIPLLFIPTTLIGSFTLVLVPELSEYFYKKDYLSLKSDVEKSLKFTVFLTCLFIPVFIVCGEEIGVLVFDSYECGKYLTASAFLMFFMSVSSLTTSILNSIGLENKTLFYYIISMAFMLLAIWFLPKFIGVYALLIGFTFVYGLTSILNLRLIGKTCVKKPEYKKFFTYAVIFILPTTLLGLMLEKLLLPCLGTLFTFFTCSAVLIIFSALLYFGFNLIEFSVLKDKIKLPKFIRQLKLRKLNKVKN